MPLALSPSATRSAVLAALVSIHMTWLRFLNAQVPDPYLDEVFHVPQAQAYWAGRWSHWDDKITTPPGVYLWSYVFNVVRRITAQDPTSMLSVGDLRSSNVALVFVLMLTLCAWVTIAGRRVNEELVLQREMVMMEFPLLAFFSGLYYTDLFSAWTVVATFVAWEAGRRCVGVTKFLCQIGHLVLGLLSLASRQTNIFWVAVFLGGMQAVDTVQKGSRSSAIQDPEVSVATIEDIFHLIFQLVPAAISLLPSLIVALWPQLTLLASFAGFVVWNGGVVLGDKSNHIATIHFPQLLYIWPCIVFFSWPTLLSQISKLRLRQQLPRAWLAIVIMSAMATAVHYNTIVHPFTLADSRHYVFYVFRILMRKQWIKYAAVPVYFVCACLVIGALANGQRRPDGENNTVRLSFVLVWFASTALSLVSAPLVEPRYFIVPWLIWRMYLPDNDDGDGVEQVEASKKKEVGVKVNSNNDDSPNMLRQVLKLLASYSLWIELAWYVLINYVTCWMFLTRGFEWTQEPGRVQRFMW